MTTAGVLPVAHAHGGATVAGAMTIFRAVATGLLLPLAACSNYDFARAELPDGSYDVPRLIADLQASGTDALYSVTWVPLLYLRMRRFEPSEVNFPKGYTLERRQSFGPVFCVGSSHQQVVDLQGAHVEDNGHAWLGWGVLYHDQDQSLPTPFGERHADQGRILLLWGWDDAGYEHPTTAPASRPARQ